MNHPTTQEITKAACSLVSFLNFKGKKGGMFYNSCLPTLDTEPWIQGDKTVIGWEHNHSGQYILTYSPPLRGGNGKKYFAIREGKK